MAYAFAGILMMVSLQLLDGSREEGRSQERCQHMLDIVETYGRMSGTKGKGDGIGDDDEEDDDQNDEDGDGNEFSLYTLLLNYSVSLASPLAAYMLCFFHFLFFSTLNGS